MTPPTGRPLFLATLGVFLLVAAVGATTCGDFGLTWDEPVYRQSQIRATIWLRRLASARTSADLEFLFDSRTLHYYWIYGRFGINFHPPLAGILDLVGHEVFGYVMKDVPSRRMGAVLCLAGAAALLFRTMSRRYGFFAGIVSAGCLVLTPRVFADGQIGATDAPGLFFWPAAALAFWSGMNEEKARRSRIAAGALLGLAFLVKPVAAMVVLPLMLWYLVVVSRSLFAPGWTAADVADAGITLLPLFAWLAVSLLEIHRLSGVIPPPNLGDIFLSRVPSRLPGWWMGVPAVYWFGRRLSACLFRKNAVLGRERPLIETPAAAIGIAPLIVWLGNPAWWRVTIPRLAHYYSLSLDRRKALPQMPVLYFGESYLYSSPWESGWVWLAVTIPLTILAAELLGAVVGLFKSRTDKLPLFFLLNAAILPLLRIFSVPGHDGTRLMLPAFFFLAGLGGWGASALARLCSRLLPKVRRVGIETVVGGLILIPALVTLVRVHPYEMSYYNPALGGPNGAWRKGLELTYWFDALAPRALAEIATKLPPSAQLMMVNGVSSPFDYFETLQALGQIRPDVRFHALKLADFPYVFVLTADSKTDASSRILFLMKPFWSLEPEGVDGARLASIYEPRTTGVALCLQVLTDVTPGNGVPPKPAPKSPAWVREHAPFLGRFWGDADGNVPRLGVNESIFEWARTRPQSLRAAARIVAEADPKTPAFADPDAQRLLDEMKRLDAVNWSYSIKARLIAKWALPIAVEILIRHGAELRGALLRRTYTDPRTIGGYLDRDVEL